MSDYNNLVNASILTPTASTDLGSDSNRYNNIFSSKRIYYGDIIFNINHFMKDYKNSL